MDICWACDGKGFYMRGIVIVECGYCCGTGITGEKENEREEEHESIAIKTDQK